MSVDSCLQSVSVGVVKKIPTVQPDFTGHVHTFQRLLSDLQIADNDRFNLKKIPFIYYKHRSNKTSYFLPSSHNNKREEPRTQDTTRTSPQIVIVSIVDSAPTCSPAHRPVTPLSPPLPCPAIYSSFSPKI